MLNFNFNPKKKKSKPFANKNVFDDASSEERKRNADIVSDHSRPDLVEIRAVRYTEEIVGRGVFAIRDIPRGEKVETSHTILVSLEEYETHMKHTVLEHYLYRLPSGKMFCVLGLGSLFNHSERPNLDYRLDENSLVVRYFAARDIAKDEELFIYYGSKLWFNDNNDNKKSTEQNSSMHQHMDDENTFLGAMEL